MIVWLFIACMSVHKVGTLSDYENSSAQVRNASILIDVASQRILDRHNDNPNVGSAKHWTHQVPAPEVITGLIQVHPSSTPRNPTSSNLGFG